MFLPGAVRHIRLCSNLMAYKVILPVAPPFRTP